MPTTKHNKTILVLGATSGIAMSLIFLIIRSWKNCKFILLARDISKLQELRRLAEKNGHGVETVTYDLLSPTEVHFQSVHYYLVFAGWFPNNNNEPAKTMKVNFTSIKEFTNVLVQDNEHSLEQIVITGSIAGVRRRNKSKDYGAAKQALHEYAYQLQKTWGNRFATTLVIPGYVNTKMTAGMDLPKILTAQPEKLAEKYMVWLKKKPRQVYSQPAWRLIAMILKLIPEFIMKRLNF